jgi:hypothetical protein
MELDWLKNLLYSDLWYYPIGIGVWMILLYDGMQDILHRANQRYFISPFFSKFPLGLFSITTGTGWGLIKILISFSLISYMPILIPFGLIIVFYTIYKWYNGYLIDYDQDQPPPTFFCPS